MEERVYGKVIIVCGDRNWDNKERIRRRLEKLPKDTIVIEGGAPGADTQAREVAEELGLRVERFPAQWGKYGRAAGPIRNKRMLGENPELVIAFHGDIEKSKGTKHMLNIAEKAGVKTELIKEEVNGKAKSKKS